MPSELEELVIKIAVDNQRIADEQDTLNKVFGESLIVPADKVNAIIVGSAFIFVVTVIVLCGLFGFVWYLDRPI